jgi:hypothetical protein
MGMINTKTNAHGEQTVLTQAAAMKQAEDNARFWHGEWFVWMHKSGEWYTAKKSNVPSLEDAELNVKAGSKVYLIGGGGPHSMTFSRYGADILKLWARNAKIFGW